MGRGKSEPKLARLFFSLGLALEVREKANDSTVAVEAQFLTEEIGSFKLQICCMVWYDILFKINTTSKLLQSTNMQLDVAVGFIQKNKEHLVSQRTIGFKDTWVSAREICEQISTESVLKENRLWSTKIQKKYSAADEPQTDAMERLEVQFLMLWQTVASILQMAEFQPLEEVGDNFRVLLNFSQHDAQTQSD